MNAKIAVHGGVMFLGADAGQENLELEELSADPVSPNLGRIWVNVAEKRIKFVASLDSNNNNAPVISAVVNKDEYLSLVSVVDSKASATHQHAFVDLTGKPTTLAGYGIVDAQPLDANLTAIAGLATNNGFLKKTAGNTWSLDTNTYLTANQSINVSGDATGTGTTSIALTLVNSGVVAGTYNNSATSITPFAIDSKGRVTSVGAAVTITPAWSSITSKPTTIVGYGITDALALGSVLPSAPGSAAVGTATTAAHADHVHPLQTSVSGNAGTASALQNARSISMTGDVSWSIPAFDGSSNVTASATLANSGVTAGTYNDSAVSVTPFTVDGKGRIIAVGSAITIAPDWTSITNKPTTLAGYGIADSYANKLVMTDRISVAQVSGSASQIALNNTAPAATAGSALFTSPAYTPNSNTSTFVIQFSATVSSGTNSRSVTVTLYRKITAAGAWSFVGFASTFINNANRPSTLSMLIEDSPATTSDVYYMARIGLDGGGTWYVGQTGSANMGGGNSSTCKISEYMP